ncbi:MAG: response regulator transcription factor [Eubacterium sp.]|nr:response regulator transcription factor [Eubacterium sp.]
MKRICIFEDDKGIREELCILLENAGYEVVEMEDYENPVESVMGENPDMILLDINLPFKNGKDILKEVRKKSQVPVIMVTSSDTERDEIISMGYGADDYITKPYNPTLLLLRIGNIFKRMGGSSDTAQLGNATIDFRRSMLLSEGGEETVLTKNEMLILSYLYNHMDSIVSRDELMTDLWNNSEYLNDNALTVNISRLRSKLAGIGLENAIETRKGQGYILSKI